MRRWPALATWLLLLCSAGVSAQGNPNPADLLFERPQWRAAAPGTRLVYRYQRATPLESVFGPSFEDRIGPFEDVTSNPVLLLFLEHHLETLTRTLKANPRYFKNAIRAALRDKASVTPTTVEWRGQSLPGWRIEARPFVDDAHKDRMRGLESLTYTFTASDAVPGGILSMEAKAVAADGNELFREILAYDQSAG